MQEIILDNREYILVEVPDGAYNCQTWNHGVGFKHNNLEGFRDTNGFLHLHTGLGRRRNTVCLGMISNILKDEKICKGLVESKRIKESWSDNMATVYLNYSRKLSLIGLYCQQSTDSFLSYLESVDLDMTKEYLLIQKL
jgi:hypothetical protein